MVYLGIFFSSSYISNQKLLNSLSMIDLVSFLLELLEISLLKVLIKLISKGCNLETTNFIATREIRSIIL